MNLKTGLSEAEHIMRVDTLTDNKFIHAQFRRVRYTTQGTYLVPSSGVRILNDPGYPEIPGESEH